MSTPGRVERIADWIMADPSVEPFHADDCPACDMAREIVADIGAVLDPHENWYPDEPTEASMDGTLARDLERRTAHVLHRRLAGSAPGGSDECADREVLSDLGFDPDHVLVEPAGEPDE